MKFELIDEWRKWYKMYSVWAFIILGASPELYNLAIQFNIISGESAPAFLARIINLIAFFGAAGRMLKQKAVELEAERLAKERAEAEAKAAEEAAKKTVIGDGIHPGG